jgi:outer membrane receptor protein involved in Fe transport
MRGRLTRVRFVLLLATLLAGSFTFAQEPGRARFQVAGQVTERGSGEPVVMASVVIRELGLWAVTDADGRFVLTGVPAGRHELEVDLLGYETLKRPLDVKGNISKLKLELAVSSLTLDEVVVTAKEGGEITSSSKISKQTLEHIQPSSLRDVMQLLPGSVTENPSLTQVGTLSIRDIGTNAANVAGTALIVDGASYSNDANLQMLLTGTAMGGGESNVASTAGGGVDSRQISTDNIESVEVIRGIPSVVYGDLTSGAVVVKTKAGVTPWEIRLKADPQLKQVSFGKGFPLGEKGGVLNFDADYAHAASDVRTPSSAYNRVNFQAGWSGNIRGKFTINAKLRGNWSNATNASDPDLALDELSQARDRGLRLGVNGRWVLNKSWITNVEYLLAGSITDQFSRSRVYQGSAGRTPTSNAMYDGENEAFFTPAQYYSDVQVFGRPIDAQAKLTAHQIGKYGDVTNKVLAGFEWKSQGNIGWGKVFDPLLPPSPGSATAFRERSYRDIPFLHALTGYVEDNLKLPLGGTLLELQAGARFNTILASGINTGAFFGIEPRINARYTLVKRSSGLRELVLRGGWGLTSKMPSMIYLYPEPAYKDMVSFYYNDFDANNTGLAVVTTQRAETDNPTLRLQRSRNIEAGLEFDAGKLSGSVVGFHEKMRDGYGFITEYVLMVYKRYGYTWKNGAPSQVVLPSGADLDWRIGSVTMDGQPLPSIVDTTFMSLSRPANDIATDKWGVEFTLDVAKIPAIGTSINVSGAWMHMASRSTAYTQRLYAGTANGRSYPWVGIYGGSSTTSNGSEKDRFSSNVRFITHIPQLAMVVTLTAQLVFFESSRNLCTFDGKDQAVYDPDAGTWKVSPLYIMDRAGRVQPFTEEMAQDPQYRNLILTTNTDTYYVRQGYPFYGMLNLRLSKEIGKWATVSFYANNFLNLRGRVRNTVTHYPSDRNTPLYFGAEVKISLR